MTPGVDVVPGRITPLDRLREMHGSNHPVRHLDVEPRANRFGGVAHPEDPVADHEPLEPPLVTQDLGEQAAMVTAIGAVHLVVGAHHARHTLVDDPSEVREIDLVQCDLVDLDVDREPGVLHRVARKVLHTREDMALETPGQRRPHLTDMVGVLAVGLLGPTPRRMPEQVHAHRAGEIGAGRTQLAPDRVADPLLEVGVPGGTAAPCSPETPSSHRRRTPGPVGELGENASIPKRSTRVPQARDGV